MDTVRDSTDNADNKILIVEFKPAALVHRYPGI
jgi:hypothetical protein